MVDDTKPTITPISFRKDMRGRSKMTFKIKDEMPTTGRGRGLSFTASVDGKWILMRYDEKITVKDDRGNRAVLNRTFIR